MPEHIKIGSIANINLLPTKILLVESDVSEIARIKLNVDREFQVIIEIATNYDELMGQIAQERPQLVILGKIDKNYFDICQKCHEIWEHLPIILLSKQKVISDSFRRLVKTCGMTDIIAQDPIKLNQLFQALAQYANQPISTEVMNLILTKLSEIPVSQLEQTEPLPELIAVIPLILPQPIITGAMILAGLREIVAISNNYFGTLAQGNYWRKAHARIIGEFPFVSDWSADHFGKLGCDESILNRELTAEEIHSLGCWVQFFIEECERIIIDFRIILDKSDISPLAKDLLATS